MTLGTKYKTKLNKKIGSKKHIHSLLHTLHLTYYCFRLASQRSKNISTNSFTTHKKDYANISIELVT